MIKRKLVDNQFIVIQANFNQVNGSKYLNAIISAFLNNGNKWTVSGFGLSVKAI